MARRRLHSSRTTYRVVLRPLAEQDLDGIAAHIGRDNPDNAARFVDRILAAIARLDQLPGACPVAPESEMLLFTIRQLVVPPYRILFAVEGDTVRILRVHHAQRLPLDPAQL